MKFLPTKVHAVLDYIVGTTLILAPAIFSFTYIGGPAVVVPQALGAALIFYSLLTKYEWGVYKIIPMKYHLIVDFLAAVFLIASPWLLGFNDEKAAAWVPHVVVGAAVILVVLVSRTTSSVPIETT